MQSKFVKPFLKTDTGGFGFSALLQALVGIFLIIIQVFMLIQPIEGQGAKISQFLPGAFGIGMLVWAIVIGCRKGQITIFGDRIEGQKKDKKAFSFQISEIELPEMRSNRFLIKDKSNKIVLLESAHNKNALGLVWLLKQYSDWPLEMWTLPFGESSFQQAARHFLDENGNAQTCDIGFVVNLSEQEWYFPNSIAVQIIGDQAKKQRIYENPNNSGELPMQFEPSPARLPLAWMCNNILNSALDNAQKISYLDQLAENHGGQICDKTDEDNVRTGECLGQMTSLTIA